MIKKKVILTSILMMLAVVTLSAKEVVYTNDKATDVKLVVVEEEGNPYLLSLDGKGVQKRGNPYRPALGVRDISGKAETVVLSQSGDTWKAEVDGPVTGFLMVSYDGGESWYTRVRI